MKDFLSYCKDNYKNLHCFDEVEFENDLKTLKYIKVCFRKYITNFDINIQIVLNHFQYLYNCFGDSLIEIMFYDFQDYYYGLLKTFFKYFGFTKDLIIIDNKIIDLKDYQTDNNLYQILLKSKRTLV